MDKDICMETVQEPTIEDMAQKIKEAVGNGFTSSVQDYPREAFVLAAWQGLAEYHREEKIWGGINELRVKQYRLEIDARMELLTDEERQQAEQLANDWLDDNFDK